MKLLGFKDETGNSNDSLDYCWTWGLGGRPLNLDYFYFDTFDVFDLGKL